MSSAFLWERRVEFHETDAAGIAHFSSLLIFMEQAEHALLRSLGLSVASHATTHAKVEHHSGPDLRWPRLRVEAQFESPVRFEDVLSIQTHVAAIGQTSVVYEHQMSVDQRLVATGSMKCVCCLMEDSKLSSHRIPDSVRQLLSKHMMAPTHDHRGN